MTDAGVDRISKINWCRALGQLDHVPFGGEAEHLIRIHLQLDRFEKFVVIVLAIKLFRQRGNPLGRVNSKGVFGTHAVAVGPMRRHARLGHVMHLAGANLYLDPLAIAPRHRGVDRAITVGFWLADIILEPPRHRAPTLVDGAKRAVAVFLRAGNDAEPINVGEAGKALILLLHLAPDRIGFLRATKDFSLNARLFQLQPHVAGDPVDHIAGFPLQGDKTTDDRLAPFWVQHLKREVFQLLTHPLHPHAACQRRIDVHGLPRLLSLFFRTHGADGPHIMKPVRKLDQNDPKVLGHCHKQFAEVFRLLGFARRKLQVGQLGDPIDQHRNFLAKAGRDLLKIGLRVFDGVMKERGDNRGIVQPLLRQDRGHRYGMRKIGFTRMTELPLVHLLAKSKGITQALFIRLRVIVADQGNQVVSRSHRRSATSLMSNSPDQP